jgi:hypothetical protein
MTRKPQRSADDPGITRLAPEGRTYHFPQDIAEFKRHMEAFAREWNAAKGWTFDGHIAPAEQLARKHAPRPGSRPSRGTTAWIAAEILKEIADVRDLRGRPGDGDLIAAVNAGQWYGHLETKLRWQTEALVGEGVLPGRREGGRVAAAVRGRKNDESRAQWWEKNLVLRRQGVARRTDRVARIIKTFALNRDADFRRVRDHIADRERKAGLPAAVETVRPR